MQSAARAALQTEDKVFSLNQRKRNAGRFVVLAVVGVVTYGRGRERQKAMMAGTKVPALIIFANMTSVAPLFCYSASLPVWQVYLHSEARRELRFLLDL